LVVCKTRVQLALDRQYFMLSKSTQGAFPPVGSPLPIADFQLPMSIDHPTVRHVARLARIAIDEAELPALALELARALELADELAQAPLDGVVPMAHPLAQTLAWREDVVTEGDRADAFLAQAPESRGGLYLVPKVIE
jgi:aspartyl-tRNA(Asn)/glutamyl-tRNA(Gln) amidotransferase subunit C